MYVPAHFREERPDVLAAAIRAIHLATLVTAGADGDYHASLVPMLLHEDGAGLLLECHVARPNDHWRALLGGPLASLAIFQGPHAYISPSWYPTKGEHGRVVPTWNYIAVHAQGPLAIVDDEAWLRAHLDALVRANEDGREPPWAVADAPAEFIHNLSRGVVGLRLRVERLEGKWKLSQNRAEADRRGAIAGLAASSKPRDRAIAQLMRDREDVRASTG